MTTTTDAQPDRVAELLKSGRMAVVDAGSRMVTARVMASGSDAVYRARAHVDGWTSCTCPAATCRPRRRCTHVRALLLVSPWSLRAAVEVRRDGPAGEKEEESA